MYCVLEEFPPNSYSPIQNTVKAELVLEAVLWSRTVQVQAVYEFNMKLVHLITVTAVFCLKGYFISCYDLTLLHVNDIHVRMEETSKYSSTCKQEQKDAGRHCSVMLPVTMLIVNC